MLSSNKSGLFYISPPEIKSKRSSNRCYDNCQVVVWGKKCCPEFLKYTVSLTATEKREESSGTTTTSIPRTCE